MTVYEQTNVRLPQGIKVWLKSEAKKNRRSLSAEVTYRLEQSREADESVRRNR